MSDTSPPSADAIVSLPSVAPPDDHDGLAGNFDILALILKILSTDRCQSDILHFALASKDFYETAWPFLWKRAPPPKYIFQAMGPNLFDVVKKPLWDRSITRQSSPRSIPALFDHERLLVDGVQREVVTASTIRLRRPIYASDWVQLWQRAKYIQELTPPSSDDDGVYYPSFDESTAFNPKWAFSGDTLRILLDSSPSLPFFTGVRKLHLHLHMLPYVPLFVGANIVDLSLHFAFTLTDRNSAIRGFSFIYSLPASCPNLKVLRLIGFPLSDTLAERFASAFPSLRSITCGLLGTMGFLHLSRKPDLRALMFRWPTDLSTELAFEVPDWSSHLPDDDFAHVDLDHEQNVSLSLQNLCIKRVYAVRDLTPIIYSAQFPLLDQIVVDVRGIDKDMVEEGEVQEVLPFTTFAAERWLGFFEALQGRCSHDKLRRICLDVDYSWDEPFLPLDLTALASISTLQPLFSFSAMTHFVFNAVNGFDMGDAELAMVARAWPFLECLSLASTVGWASPSRVTLKGLVSLLTFCPHLTKLGLVLDATAHDGTTSATPLVQNHKITDIHLGNSPIDAAHCYSVAAYLSHILPNLVDMYFWDDSTARVSMAMSLNVSETVAQKYAEIWEDVSALVSIFSRVRMEIKERAVEGLL
ncbi:hypothetical protein PLICRDRAFT_176786 [Plicaturopsis crispa FD-325 SS-3]|nr:hypothetical protein PLICRDRAFT_176786 [Plicaturopsis crispa FD-325 SS-3]